MPGPTPTLCLVYSVHPLFLTSDARGEMFTNKCQTTPELIRLYVYRMHMYVLCMYICEYVCTCVRLCARGSVIMQHCPWKAWRPLPYTRNVHMHIHCCRPLPYQNMIARARTHTHSLTHSHYSLSLSLSLTHTHKFYLQTVKVGSLARPRTLVCLVSILVTTSRRQRTQTAGLCTGNDVVSKSIESISMLYPGIVLAMNRTPILVVYITKKYAYCIF